MTDIKQMPSSREAERMIIGSILLEPSSIERAMPYITKPEVFWRDVHKFIWMILVEMHRQKRTIELVSVLERCKDRFGDRVTIVDLTEALNSVVSAVNIEAHCQIILERYLQREIVKDARNLEKQGLKEYDENLLYNYESRIRQLRELQPRKDKNIEEVVSETMDQLETSSNIIPFGIFALDHFAGGMTRKEMTVIGGRPSHGKLLSNNTLILTTNGWKKNKNLTLKDKIYGIDGKSYNILGIYPEKNVQTYIVKFSDGSKIECCKDHLWAVSTRKKRKRKIPDHSLEVMTTQELIDNNVKTQDKRNNYKLPEIKPMQFSKRDLPLHPYVLGSLIADGTLKSTTLYSGIENDIINKIKKLLPENASMEFKQKCTYSIKGIRSIIKKLKLNVNSGDKFIPEEYLYSSINDRINLLHGLIDGDGYIPMYHNTGKYKTNTITYLSKSYRLIKDMQLLVKSLGGITKIRKIYKKSQDWNKNKTYYEIAIRFNNDIIPVSSKKHLTRYSNGNNKDGVFITKIIKTNKYQDMQCLKVDSPDNLFIVENFIPTHNTSVALNIIKGLIEQGYRVIIFNREMTNTEMMKKLITLEAQTLSYRKVRRHEFTPEEKELTKQTAQEIKEKYKNLIMYDDIRDLNTAIQEVKRHKPDVFIDDYIQQIKVETKFDQRRHEIEHIINEYKWLVKEVNCAAILVSQLNREIEKRHSDPVPHMSDFAESGSIEQACESCIFTFRGYVFDSEQYDKHELLLSAAKVRYGEIGRYEIGFNGDRCRIYGTKQEATLAGESK